MTRRTFESAVKVFNGGVLAKSSIGQQYKKRCRSYSFRINEKIIYRSIMRKYVPGYLGNALILFLFKNDIVLLELFQQRLVNCFNSRDLNAAQPEFSCKEILHGDS